MWALGSHRNNQELWKQGNEKCINGGRGHLAIYYYINELANFCDEAAKICRTSLTLFRMGLFGTTHGWGRGQKELLPKICHTYPTMMKLGTVIPYPKKIQKYMNHVTHPLSSADISIFSPEISKFCYMKKYRYRLYFDT